MARHLDINVGRLVGWSLALKEQGVNLPRKTSRKASVIKAFAAKYLNR